MKILYDQVSKDYQYPISKKDLDGVRKNNVIRHEVWEKVAQIRFGCNTKTTQEGRTVQKGNLYEIRINFILRNFKTLLLSDSKPYLNLIKNFGGVLEKGSRWIS